MDNTTENNRSLKVAFHTLGCRSNFADTVDIQAALLAKGIGSCDPESGEADVYLINTCTVTNGADKEAKRLIRRAYERSPNARIVVTGCMAEVKQKELLGLKNVDTVIGPGRHRALVNAIVGEQVTEQQLNVELPEDDSLKRGRHVTWVSNSIAEPLSKLVPGPGGKFGDVQTRGRFHLRVQEGCEQSCTYCIIPQTRGGFSSRPEQEILRDIERLAEIGYREVVITGTHLGGYGVEFGRSFADLLRLLERESAIRRIRVSSIDPNDVTPEIIDIFAKSNVLCPHLHICVQAFSDKLLKLMNRAYRLAEVKQTIKNISEKIPGCCLGSDLITGFPGESREDVEQAIALFLDLPFSYLHVFPYSERENTAALKLAGSVEKAERTRRSARWRGIAQNKKREFYRSLVGKELAVIIEGLSERSANGTSREFANCRISESFLKSNSLRIGEEIRVYAESYDEMGEELVCR